MDKRAILARVDHTLLKPEATEAQVLRLCDEALAYQAASVCISPVYVATAAEYLAGRLPVCTVIGFPSGAVTQGIKCREAEEALHNGADEIDMVIHVGLAKMARWQALLEEIKAVKQVCGAKILKVIVEACLLTEDEKRKLCALVSEAGADFIKTSTGFSSGGATYEDVALFRQELAPQVKIKAAGGVRDWQTAAEFIRLGADRLGSSALIPLAMREGL